MNPKGRKKKKPKVELVTKCDRCGNDLGRTCARTEGSLVCAAGAGVYVNGTHLGFFCSAECRYDNVYLTEQACM
jgi:hypothetical protein